MTSDPAYFTVDEVADRLRIGHMSVRRLVATGALVGYKFGGQVRIERPSVEAYVKSSRIGAPS